eukprot:981423-Amphidinium_carterae.1
MWSSVLLQHLEAYSRGHNADAFMVRSLRRALVPIGSLGPEVFDTALLQQLNDISIVQAAEFFASLRSDLGVVVLAGAMHHSGRQLVDTCQFALASTLQAQFPSADC